MTTVVVSGYLVRFPLAGNVWAQLPYVVGLARLGFDVWFVEDAGWEDSCFNPRTRAQTSDPAAGLEIVTDVLTGYGLGERIAFRDSLGRWHGPAAEIAPSLFEEADLYLEVGGTCRFDEARGARVRALVDMDPVFTQLGAFGHDRLDSFDHHFTYGLTLNRERVIPTGGIEWQPLLPPVLIDEWDASPSAESGAPWTTIASWQSYGSIERDGEIYGQKDIEFRRFIELPSHTDAALELALTGRAAPVDELRGYGWLVRDALEVTSSLDRYRAYIWGSRGEWSVAKDGYVRTRSGWFSDRTAAYLASGRPAVVQETGISDVLPTGEGLMTFADVEEAAAALASVERDHERQCTAASGFAAKHLSYELVLGGLLDRVGLP